MLEELYKSIVPVVRATIRGAPPELLGTGIVISPTVVITCRHVIDELQDVSSIERPEPTTVGILRGRAVRAVTQVRASSVGDICALYVRMREKKPAPLSRLRSVINVRLAAAGFLEDDLSFPRKVPELAAIQEHLGGEWVEGAQLGSGVPGGFSGGPVLVQAEGVWRVIGMISLGGETSHTSRMIGVDPIASFLATEGSRPDVTNLPSVGGQRPAGGGQISVRAGRDILRSSLEAQGKDISVDAGRDLRDSDLNLNGRSPEAD